MYVQATVQGAGRASIQLGTSPLVLVLKHKTNITFQGRPPDEGHSCHQKHDQRRHISNTISELLLNMCKQLLRLQEFNLISNLLMSFIFGYFNQIKLIRNTKLINELWISLIYVYINCFTYTDILFSALNNQQTSKAWKREDMKMKKNTDDNVPAGEPFFTTLSPHPK